MPLLVGNLQRLAESNVHPPQDTEADGQAPQDPHRGRWEPAAQHVAPAGESDARMHVSQNRGNAAHVYENDTHLTGNAAQNHQGSAAQSHQGNAAQKHHYQGNAAQNYQGNAAQSFWGSVAQCYPGNAAREQMMNHPPWSFIPPWRQWFFLPPSRIHSPGNQSRDTPSHDSTPGPSGVDEDSITSFVSDSERGDLFSSEDSEVSDDEEDAIPPANA